MYRQNRLERALYYALKGFGAPVIRPSDGFWKRVACETPLEHISGHQDGPTGDLHLQLDLNYKKAGSAVTRTQHRFSIGRGGQ